MTNPRSLTVEREWLPASLDDLVAIRERLRAAGYSHREIAGLSGWLLAKIEGQPDETAQDTRARYRKMLADLGPSLYPGGSPIISVPGGYVDLAVMRSAVGSWDAVAS